MLAAILARFAPYRLMAEVAVVAAMVGAVAVQTGRLSSATADASAQRALLVNMTGARDALAKDLTDQNAAVTALKKASDAQATSAAIAAKTAAQGLVKAQARIRALQTATVPTACPDALEWARQELFK